MESESSSNFTANKNPRIRLPDDQIHGGCISIWDLAKRSLPIHAFEPLSILQAVCEELRFAGQFLDKLHEVEDPDERMLRIVGFIVSGYTGLVGRNRKPFNPMLGETFDFIHKDGWKYHSEQISHHPSISAGHANSRNGWEWFQTLQTKITHSIDLTIMQPLLPVRLRLSNGDEYSWNKVDTMILNPRGEAEKRQVRNRGTMIIKSNTGVTAELRFADTEENPVEGDIRSRDERVVHRLVGTWHKGIFRLFEDGRREPIFVAVEKDPANARQYGFNEFTVQLNELPREIHVFLPPTDSRLRSDIRYLENAEARKAEFAKKELEQTQRSRSLNSHKQVWFTEELDIFTGSKLWLTNNRYWQSKREKFKDSYSKQILPLFRTDK